MKRRDFIQNAALTSVLPFSAMSDQNTQKEWYEWRTYELGFRDNRPALTGYLNEVLKPTLLKLGANHFMVFSELGQPTPAKMHILISYPSLEIFAACQQLHNNPDHWKAAEAYFSLDVNEAAYSGISSSLLLAFDGLPSLITPPEDSGLFELRIYQGYSEDAVRRKIKMFDVEEIELFYKTKLNPVFFGDMIIGPYRPTLVYMLHFKDMEERDANWRTFLDHPEWKRMLAAPEYANTVDNILRTFLVRA